jgi:hypothetical protein
LDISRDHQGSVLWDADNVKSRSDAPPLMPEDFGTFDEIARQGSGARAKVE